MYPPDLPLFINTPDPDSNSSSRLEELQHLASSSFCFPYSPYTLQYSEDHFFTELTWEQLQDRPLLTDHHQTMMPNQCDAPKQDAAPPEQGFLIPRDELSNSTRKRPMKKDRHSKITTAKGPRDRRMRLSLDVARKFFDLQDALGYDTASKIVEWLFIQANSAIDEFLQGYTTATTAASVSSTHSECEVVSGIDDAGATATTAAVKGSKKMAKVVSAKRTRESRMEARERARKRTLARKGVDLKPCMEGGWWGQSIGQKDEQRDYGGGDDMSVITRCCIYQQQDDAAQTSHGNELEYCGKAWEAYNNM